MRRYTDCIVPEDGHRNEDGYIRVLDKPRPQGGKLKFLHRIEWEKVNGPIPDGHEVNHRCKNRQCANINHLEVISRSEHKSRDNADRYRKRANAIHHFALLNPTLSQRAIAKEFGVAQATVSKILKRKR